MEKVFLKLISISYIRPAFLRLLVGLHNKMYKCISLLAQVHNNGVHPKHQILNYHSFFVNNVEETDRVIDVGCGNGLNAYDIAQKATEVVGIDVKKKNIAEAMKNCALENTSFFVADATTYMPDQPFDKIVLSNVLEHIEDRVQFLMALHNVGKVLLLRVPMITRDWISVYKKDSGLEYRLDSSHFVEYRLENLCQEIDQSGWMIKNYSIQFGEFWGVLVSK